MKKLLISVALIALAGSALAQDAMKATRVKPNELTWKDNPALPKGAQFAVLVGDPTKGHLEKFLSPSRHESDSVTVRGHGRMERAGHGAEGLFRC